MKSFCLEIKTLSCQIFVVVFPINLPKVSLTLFLSLPQFLSICPPPPHPPRVFPFTHQLTQQDRRSVYGPWYL